MNSGKSLKALFFYIGASFFFFVRTEIVFGVPSIAFDLVLQWDFFYFSFVRIIGILSFSYLAFVLVRMIISAISKARSPLSSSAQWLKIFAQHYQILTLWFWVGAASLAVFFAFRASGLLVPSRLIGVLWGGASILLLSWLIWSVLWLAPMPGWRQK